MSEFDRAEFERKKREIETELNEYEAAIDAASEWMKAWKARRPKGFRAVRREA